MMIKNRNNVTSWIKLLPCLLLAAGIFILDINIPLGVATGVLYGLFVITSIGFRNKYITITWALISAVLIFVGYFASPKPEFSKMEWIFGLNRLLSVVVVWVIAVLLLLNQSEKPLSPEPEGSKSWRRIKTFLFLFIPLSLLLVGAILYYHNQRVEDAMKVQQSEDHQSIKFIGKVIGAQIEEIISESVYLSSTSEMEQYLADPTEEHAGQLEKTLTGFLSDRNFYDHISFFDARGAEGIKVTNKDRGKAITNATILKQQPEVAEAFDAAIKMDRGEFFLANITVYDSTKMAPVPVAIFGIPLSYDNQKAGTLVSAYLSQDYLDDLFKVDGIMHEYLVIKSTGELSWGKIEAAIFNPLLNGSSTFDQLFPAAWQTMRQSATGAVTNRHGVYSFLDINPELVVLRNLKLDYNVVTQNMDLQLVLFTPKSAILNRIGGQSIIWLIGIGLVLLGILVWFISWIWVSRESKNQQLQKLHDELDKFFTISSGMLCLAKDGRFIRLSKSWTDVLGYEIEEMLSQSFTDFVHPDDLERTREVAASLYMEKKLVDFENRYKDKNGQYHWLSWIATYDEETQLTYTSATDITKQKEQTEQLKQYTEDLRMQQQELEQNNEELEAQTRSLEQSQQDLKNYTEELKTKTELLEQKNAALQLTKEELFAKAEELERVSQFKSDFLANMSHELRTPLNSVSIFATLLEENKQQNLTEKQIEFASIIKKCGNDLLLLINDILDLSKIESGKLDYIVEEVVLKDVVNDMDMLHKESARLKNIAYTSSLDNDLPAFLFTDGVKIEQILKNLLTNAFKFTGKGGNISLAVKVANKDRSYDHPALVEAGKVIAFEVTDTGIGIAKAKQQIIFDAFQQADGSLKRRFGGTGLGLAICSRLAAGLGGEIQLESEEGKGSTFTLLLPDKIEVVSEEDQPKQKFKPVSAKAISEVKISTAHKGPVLVVEDDPQQNASIAEFIKSRFGIKCHQAFSGKEALELLKKEMFEAVILDLGLTDMDGAKLVNQAGEDLRDTPVILYTARDISPDQEKDLKNISDTIILKTAHSLDRLADELYVALKRKKEMMPVFEEETEALPSLKGTKILVAEDDLRNVKALEHVFVAEEIEMLHANNGKEALDLLDKNPDIELVLMDIMMPEMDGLEATKAIRKKDQFKGLPIIMLTARAMREDRVNSLDAGASDYLAKPVELKKLMNLIRLWLSAKRGGE